MTRINNLIYKYYVTTWVFVLILFKREIPSWLVKTAQSIIDIEEVMARPEKYVK